MEVSEKNGERQFKAFWHPMDSQTDALRDPKANTYLSVGGNALSRRRGIAPRKVIH